MVGLVKVKCYNGQMFDVECADSDSVAELQAKIESASGIAADRQTLMFKGKMLEGESALSTYGLSDGEPVVVVRRIGVPSKPSEKKATEPSPPTLASAPAGGANGRPTGVRPAAMPAAPNKQGIEDIMRSMNLGGMGAPGGGFGPGGMPPGMDFQNMMSSLPGMSDAISQILNSPAMQEYLNDPAKQEESRAALMDNPWVKPWLDNDPEFASLVNDPDKWRSSMNAAKSLLVSPGGAPTSSERGAPAPVVQVARTTAAKSAPSDVNMARLSEAYGHVMGQSLVNNALGLVPEDVAKGLLNACRGLDFPMPLPQYERQMGELQKIASEILTEENLKEADEFFKQSETKPQMNVVESGKIMWEKGELEAEEDGRPVIDGKCLMLILQGRLLDQRVFFTCPAADEAGETVHPLTLVMSSAPPALKKALLGMIEGEERTIYVHPTACEGMAAMFGEMLPPNALLIFDVELVSADAPQEDEAA